MPYELKLPNWNGPLEKLLTLIEERKMEITAVSLAAVTDDFLKYLEGLRAAAGVRSAEEDLRLLSDFIAVAARLILIKSKSLLPDLALTPEEEQDIRDLEERLRLYRELQGALRHVQSAWRSKRREFARPYFLNFSSAAVFYPGRNLTVGEVISAAERIYAGFMKFALDTETIESTIISLEEKMEDIIRRIGAAAAKLSELGQGSKAELLVAFLAVLHLAREQLVHLEQASAFSDIIVRKTAGRNGSAPA